MPPARESAVRVLICERREAVSSGFLGPPAGVGWGWLAGTASLGRYLGDGRAPQVWEQDMPSFAGSLLAVQRVRCTHALQVCMTMVTDTTVINTKLVQFIQNT